MHFQNLLPQLENLPIRGKYRLDADSTKGAMIKGYDQLSIRWTENDIDKLIQIYPELSPSHSIRKWIIWICASQDRQQERGMWKKALCEKRTKAEILALAFNEIKKGIRLLEELREEDLEWDMMA